MCLGVLLVPTLIRVRDNIQFGDEFTLVNVYVMAILTNNAMLHVQ